MFIFSADDDLEFVCLKYILVLDMCEYSNYHIVSKVLQ